MKKTLSVFATLALLFFGAACVPQETNTSETGDKEGNTETSNAPSVTVGADNISAISVVLKGKANLTNSAASDLQVGFQYSKSAGILPSNSITIEADDSDANYNYSSCVTGLNPETTYYFRSIVRQKGVDSYGETLSFTTKDVASLLETLDATEVEATTATLNAKLDLTDVRCTKIDYGFYCGDTEQELNNKIGGGEIADKSFSATMTDLPHKTQYWYKAYVSLDSQIFYGDKKTFTTAVIPVESVTLDKTEHVFHTIGDILALTATILPSDATDKSIEWASDHPEVATVDSDGNVTAVDNGTATITVTTKDQGLSASCTITVAQIISSINLDKTSLTLYEGEEYSLEATINPSTAAEKAPKWTSSNEAVATVDDNGKVSAISKGSTTIRAEAKDGSGKYATCSVTVNRPVANIQLNESSLTLYRGESDVSTTLTANAYPSDASDKAIVWSSSNTSVATVSNSGEITGKSKGTAIITATANDGKGASATCEVEVKQYVTNIILDKTWLPLMIGDVASLYVTNILPETANDKSYTWSSSDSAIVSVDNSGKVTAKIKGIATIEATANDGNRVVASCSVVVYKIDVPQAVDMGIVENGKTIKWATFNIGASSPEEFGLYYAWGETEPKSDYSWSTYMWGKSSSTLTKYNTRSSFGTVDNKTVLYLDDDVAHIILKGNWRMPTDKEWTFLREKCTWTWTTQNGVNGCLVTASNGNSIFLPAANFRGEGGSLHGVGSLGYYWSSSLRTDPRSTDYPPCAWGVRFGDFGVERMFAVERCYGQSIRPVTE